MPGRWSRAAILAASASSSGRIRPRPPCRRRRRRQSACALALRSERGGVSSAVRRLPASTPFIWPASLPARRPKRSRPTSPRPSPGRELEDDAMVNLRMSRRRRRAALDQRRRHRPHARPDPAGLRREGRSALGAGAAQPALLDAASRNGRRSSNGRAAGLSPEADRATRVTVGHAEGCSPPSATSTRTSPRCCGRGERTEPPIRWRSGFRMRKRVYAASPP